jgi:putative phosphotransacetylase
MNPALNRATVESIVRDVVLQRLGRTQAGSAAAPSNLVVNASARHMHISRADLDRIFGAGYELKPLRPLYQDGHFAAQETVTLIGPRSRLISNLRILGPCRDLTQVELAFTDAITLGIENLPIRISGNTAGTPGAYIMGPVGMIEMQEGLIRAAIHVHMSPADALFYRVRQGDVMRLRVRGDSGITFDRVHVRVDPRYKLEVHMDTDEANACGLHGASDIELLK